MNVIINVISCYGMLTNYNHIGIAQLQVGKHIFEFNVLGFRLKSFRVSSKTIPYLAAIFSTSDSETLLHLDCSLKELGMGSKP